ncbi:MAG: 23S rRNA (uracil(1939)-C(5))-methyltransferase RlmD [Lachnospiraceae bacterium]|nr:23S rRNA (uracil(1939)-C(5))-methyltransferase RlmD [Lachnospiraceae bacterium]
MFQKNDRVTVTIEDVGMDGEGIGKVDGFTLFIKDAVIGDVVEAKIMKAKKNYAYARLEKVVTPSPFRVEPLCEFARVCGGCQIQAVDYTEQLRFKERKVFHDLVRIGGFDKAYVESVMEPIVGMEEPFFYRNKAQYPVGINKQGKLVAGFYAGRTHSIIANTDCKLGITANQKILEAVLQFMEDNHISAYDETLHKGLVRHVLIRCGFTTKEVMVCLVINGKSFPKAKDLVDRLLALSLEDESDEWKITSICISSNTKDTNVIMGDSFDVLYGNGYITDYIGDVAFRISPLSFYQVNPVQTKKLYELALEYANLNGGETVWDLYCGIGTISLFLAKAAGMVYGVEIIPQAIDNAKENAKLNHISNAKFYVGKAEEVLPEKYEKEQIKADVIVVDPPRKGCDEKCLNTMVKMKPERIVYVSCDPATLARDLKYLCANGYELKRVRAVDQFPHSVHVECVTLLQRKNT